MNANKSLGKFKRLLRVQGFFWKYFAKDANSTWYNLLDFFLKGHRKFNKIMNFNIDDYTSLNVQDIKINVYQQDIT